MASIRDIYTFYLEAEHLQGHSVVVHISASDVEEVFNPRIKRNERKVVLRFHGKKLAMCLNKTQAASIEAITGTDDYEKWPGHTIMLTPGVQSGKDTITVTAPPKAQEEAATPQPKEAHY